ncbi:hypothetical protein [Paenibacillus sp. sgz302251]|uniref:hypothetical protein n=1 Tax=Paenibacillus sp. sgz302251 TaxID=3414493 RepID=UPI003C7C6C32
MDVKTTAQQIRETIVKLCEDAGYTAPELLAYVDKLEQENIKLSQTVKKLRLDAVRKSSADGAMNSRLKDALRE